MFFFKCWNIHILATKKPFACKERGMCGITHTWNVNKLWHSSVLWRTQWDAISCIGRWLRITFSIPSRKLCMGVKLLGYLSLSWWTVILYHYTFSIIESISKAYIIFYLLYHNPYYNLCSSWQHVSLLKKYSHVLWVRQTIFIVCYYLFTLTFICCNLVFCFCTDTFRLRESRHSYKI